MLWFIKYLKTRIFLIFIKLRILSDCFLSITLLLLVLSISSIIFTVVVGVNSLKCQVTQLVLLPLAFVTKNNLYVLCAILEHGIEILLAIE